ncbi:MAG TPA: site-2 protease family protein [Clostridia bacterium]|nr:site-2 protease family protein [Clostridia bacterium]
MLNLILNSGSIVEVLTTAIAVLVAAFGAIMFHECAHGWVALKCGDNTAKLSGRLNLNPAKHFDMVGLLMFMVAGFGWAKPVPINPNNFRHRTRGIVLVSLAGVVTNVLLAFLSFGLLNLVQLIFNQVTIWGNFTVWFYQFWYYLFLFSVIVNISLAAFNILPLFPLDGYRVIEAFAPNSRFCRFMRRYGSYILLALILVSYILGRYFWFLDIFGMYINWVRNGMLGIMSKIWGAVFV